MALKNFLFVLKDEKFVTYSFCQSFHYVIGIVIFGKLLCCCKRKKNDE